MSKITKSDILKLIQEQISSLDEMANIESSNWKKLPILSTPLSLDIDYIPSKYGNIPVKSMDPPKLHVSVAKGSPREKINEPQYVMGKAIGYVVRVGPLGHRLLEFNNYEGEFNNEVRRWVEFDPETKDVIRGHAAMPRDPKYGTKYEPKRIPKAEEQIIGDAKKYILFPVINKFFMRRRDLLYHLDKCGISHVHADPRYTERITNVTRNMNFDGPLLYFELNAVSDQENAQRLIDNVIRERAAERRGEEIDIARPRPKWLVRPYVNEYPNGRWSPAQRAHAKKYHKLTAIYKLYMKQVQDNKAANTVSHLTIGTELNGNIYVMNGTFSAVYYSRIETSKGQEVGTLFPPVQVSVSKPLPPDINPNEIEQLKVLKYPYFFKSILNETLEELGDAIITNVDPDDVMLELMSEFVPEMEL